MWCRSTRWLLGLRFEVNIRQRGRGFLLWNDILWPERGFPWLGRKGRAAIAYLFNLLLPGFSRTANGVEGQYRRPDKTCGNDCGSDDIAICAPFHSPRTLTGSRRNVRSF
jgi:hypothetical protein